MVQNLVYLKEDTDARGSGTPLDQMRRAVKGVMYADDAGVVLGSADGLARMMTVIVEGFWAFGFTVSEKKTEKLPLRVKEKQPPPPPFLPPPLIIEPAGQRYAKTPEFRYLGDLVNERGDLTREINYRSKAAGACFRRYARELFETPRAPLRLKIRLLQAEAMEALLCGCTTWAPRGNHYRLLRTVHHRLLLPAAFLHPGPVEGRAPERRNHFPAAAPAVRGSLGEAAGRTTPETNDVRRVGGG